VDWVGVQTQIEKAIQRVLRRQLQSNPLLVFMMQIPEEAVRSEIVQKTQLSIEAPKLASSVPSSLPSPVPAPVNKVTGRRRPRTAAQVASVVS